jgi:hypothetical protein
VGDIKQLRREQKAQHAERTSHKKTLMLLEKSSSGVLEARWVWFCEVKVKAVSCQYHGGSWEGGACRKFMGLLKTKVGASTYAEAIADLVAYIRVLKNQTAEVGQFDAGEAGRVVEFLQGTFKELCTKLSAAMGFVCSTRSLTHKEVEECRTACEAYVGLFRLKLVKQQHPLVGKKQVTVKAHVLETHVPPFAAHHFTVGIHGEDAIETHHKEVNTLQRSLAPIQNGGQQMQAQDDYFNAKGEVSSMKQETKGHRVKRPPPALVVGSDGQLSSPQRAQKSPQQKAKHAADAI